MSLLDVLGSREMVAARRGQPLYAYEYASPHVAALAPELRRRLRLGARDRETAAAFVLWAAERIRSSYEKDALTWAFVFKGLDVSEDRDLAVDLVETGLGFFGRRVKRSDRGRRLYLFTLLAEGGVPEPMLRQNDKLFAHVIFGLLQEIEREGGADLDPAIAEQIAARRAAWLPDVFHNSEAAGVLARLALGLSALRRALPGDLPRAAAVEWFDRNRPGWRGELPLRLSPATLEALVVPALRLTDKPAPGGEPVAARELRHGADGAWRAFLRIAASGWLDRAALPGAEGLKLRLVGGGAMFYGDWSERGWSLARAGRSDDAKPWPLDAPFALAAYADGVAKGEAVVDLGLPPAREAPSFWRSGEAATPDSGRLVPHSGRPRTRAQNLWLLAGANATVRAEDGLTLDEGQPGPEARLCRLAGAGRLWVDGELFNVVTGDDRDERGFSLEAVGPVFSGWRTLSGGAVFAGRPVFRCAYADGGASRRLRDDETRIRPGPGLGDELVSWISDGEVLATIKAVSVPRGCVVEARETASGGLELVASGLENGWRLALKAGQEQTHATAVANSAEIALSAPKTPPSRITLQLSDPRSGRALALAAPWPARFGMIVSPDGERLPRDTPLCVEDLAGWRAVSPGGDARLLLRLQGGGEVAVVIHEDHPLTLLGPEIRTMLALGGPDAEVALSLLVNSRVSPRLQIRRYLDMSQLIGDRLSVGHRPDGYGGAQAKALDGEIDVEVHAVEIEDGQSQERHTVSRALDLREWLGPEGGLWLVMPRARAPTGSRVQRPVVWSARPRNADRREQRIQSYAQDWARLTRATDAAAWNAAWAGVEAVRRHGDIGFLDRVQALAQRPSALVKYAYLVRPDGLAAHLDTDRCAPFLWPTIPLADFVAGVDWAMGHLSALLAQFDDAPRRRIVADQTMERSRALFALRPELAAHIGYALHKLGIDDPVVLAKFAAAPSPLARLQSLAQQAAKRPLAPPSGIVALRPSARPPRCEFDGDRQRLVDAPLVAAEMALGRRCGPTSQERLALAMWRLADLDFFDAAVPAAIQHLIGQPQ